MIYSINEGFFGGNKPNKIIVADVRAAEARIKAIIKYFEDYLKILTTLKAAVCKDNFTDADAARVEACYKKWSDLDKAFNEENSDRKLTVAVNSLIRKCSNTDVSNLQFSEDTSDEYKSLVKKISANGQYTKALTVIANKILKMNDDYTIMHNKRKELSVEHNKACEKFGGMVGTAIGTIPVVKLGLGVSTD